MTSTSNNILFKDESNSWFITMSIGLIWALILLAFVWMFLLVLKKYSLNSKLVKWFGNETSNEKIRVVVKKNLSSKTYLYVVDKDGVDYMIIDNGQCVVIHQCPYDKQQELAANE